MVHRYSGPTLSHCQHQNGLPLSFPCRLAAATITPAKHTSSPSRTKETIPGGDGYLHAAGHSPSSPTPLATNGQRGAANGATELSATCLPLPLGSALCGWRGHAVALA
jgi:hypothetical protein